MSEEELIEELSSLFNDIENNERYTDTIYRNITNLQQENKELKERIDKATEYNQIILDSDYVYSQDEIATKNLKILGDKE